MAPRERQITDDEQDKVPVRSKTLLSKEDEWIDKMDLKAFREDIKELGKRLADEQGPQDVAHLHKMIMWSNMLTLVGLLGMGLPVYFVLPAVCLSVGTTSRWTMIAHHTCHGGYDNCEKSGRFNRFKFAVGSVWRRFLDWFDWMLPEAWNVEHNNMHHYHLGEDSDPDLVERNLAYLRGLQIPMFVKYIAAFGIMAIWKWWYYSPNTYKELRVKEIRKTNPELLKDKSGRFDPNEPVTLSSMIFDNSYLPSWISLSDYMVRVFLPYVIYRFVILPSPMLLAGMYFTPESPDTWYLNGIANMVLADVFANVHSFIIIATNHAGDDLYKFSSPCRPRSGTFYLRQVVSSVNFAAGTDLVDFFHGWLNYQIEHHMWPDLSMLSYQRAMPQVKEICKRHHIPVSQPYELIVPSPKYQTAGKTECSNSPFSFLVHSRECFHALAQDY
jgi:fatty acid desaturase